MGFVDSQFNLSHIYFDNFFASLSYRFAYFNKDYMHSVGLKIGTKASIPIISYNIITGEPFILLALKMPNKIEGFKKISFNDFYIGFGLQMSW